MRKGPQYRTVTIQFSNVGRSRQTEKRNWCARIRIYNDNIESAIIRELKQRTTIGDRGLNVTYESETKIGNIWFGLHEQVGHFTILTDG